jgi:hypothetical protein
MNRRPRRPRKGTRCRWCRRTAQHFGWLGRLATRNGRTRVRWERIPFCVIHGVDNEYGLVAYRCSDRECLKKRVASTLGGGWMDLKNFPWDSYVYVPLEATLSEPDHPPVKVNCPWCGTPMTQVH